MIRIPKNATSPAFILRDGNILNPNASSTSPARVLLVEESLPFRRVIREALTAFRHCEVDETPNAERAFEFSLTRPYQLLILAIRLPDMSGMMLDRLITRAYPYAHPGSHTAPPVIFLSRPEDSSQLITSTRDVRHRGFLTYPPKLDTLISITADLLPEAPGQPSLPRVS